VAASNLELQFGNFEYAYLSKYLTYIMMLLTKKIVINQAGEIYI
jgi:hypothetical protein